MKKEIFITVLLFAIALTAAAQSKEDYYKQASQLYDNKDYKNALSAIGLALTLDSVNSNYLLLKGNTLQKLNKYQESFDTYSKMIRLKPEESTAYNQRGLLLASIQQSEYAIKDFSTALAFEKSDSFRLSLFVNRGAAEIGIRNFQDAYDDFMSAFKIDSLNIGVLNNLATVCDEVGKGDQTLGYLYKIIKLDSTFTGAYGNIGFKYQEMGDYKTAIQFFDKTIALDKDEPLGYSNRAFCKYKLGDFKSALSDINFSIQLYPTNSYAFRTRAFIYLAMNENKKSCADINEALRLGFTKMYGDDAENFKAKNCH